ncbi:MAG: MFS transporter [Verrucomicrobiales bacterium]|nr:MFS transporter [Verrucomicrobiales bacterium]
MSLAPDPLRVRLSAFFFLVAMPLGMWIVPMGNIMAAYGRENLLPWMLAASAMTTFISPLVVGAMADQRVTPTVLMGWMCVATAGVLVGLCRVIETGGGTVAILSWAVVLALVSSPIWSLSTTIVLSHLEQPGRQFGPVRAWATVGWMAGGWMVSWVLHSDASVISGYAAAGFWLVAAVWSWTLPRTRPPDQVERRSWREVMGLDAVRLLGDRNHRMVFITAALYTIPLAAFYPYCVMHLRALGVPGQAAVLSLGQITEILTMLGLARLMVRFRLKWVFLSGIGFGLLRYVVFAVGGAGWVVVGILVHGLAYTLFFITTQIYLEERIERRWRGRAQALLTMLTSGVGNTSGYLLSGLWFAHCSQPGAGEADWRLFWGGLAVVVAVVLVQFAWLYKGQTSSAESSAG